MYGPVSSGKCTSWWEGVTDEGLHAKENIQRGFSCLSPVQVLAVDPDNWENGTVVYSISPENPFYTINSSTGKIRTSGVTLDRESSNARDAALMRTIIISAVDRE